jgi:gluconolactonase
MTGEVEVVLTGCDNEAFLFPNDLCFGPDGYLYLTDSGILIDEFEPGGKIRLDYEKLAYDGRVFRIHTQTKEIIKIDTGIRFTNGIAFGPDGYLYVNETLTGNIFRYKVEGDAVGKRELFGNVINPTSAPGFKGPDGMAFGENGQLYVTVFGQGDVTVLDKNGKVAERIRTKGMNPTNVAFGLPGKKQILVTEYEYGTMELFNVKTDGLELW